MNRFLGIVCVAWSTTFLSAAPIPKVPPAGDLDKMAKAAAEGLIAGMKKKDADAVLDLMDAPYWLDGGVIDEKKDLAKFIRRNYEHRDPRAENVNFEVATVLTWQRFLTDESTAKLRNRASEDSLKVLGKRLGLDGRVVIATVTQDDKRVNQAALFICVKDGVAKIVGSLD